MSGPFKQNGDKSFTSKIKFVAWAQSMDLLALVSEANHVSIYRINCEKVWEIEDAPQEAEDSPIASVAFSPDGSVIAIGFLNGFICLHEVESKRRLFRYKVKASITCLYWYGNVQENSYKPPQFPIFKDEVSQHLPELSAFTKIYGITASEEEQEEWEEFKQLMHQNEFSILLTGTENGAVHFFTYGVSPLTHIKLNRFTKVKVEKILNVHLSQDMKSISTICQVVSEEGLSRIVLVKLNCGMIEEHEEQIQIIAQKFMNLLMCSQYLKSSLSKIKEVFETTTRQMDGKIAKLLEAKKKAGGGDLVNDFLRLLLYGTKSDEMEAFFMRDNQERAIKTISRLLESYYSSMHKLLIKHIQSAAEISIYEMEDLRSMSQRVEEFNKLNFDNHLIVKSLKFAFLIHYKANEMSQVINKSTDNSKAFFKWFYNTILRHNEETGPSELTKMSHQEIDKVTEFLMDSFYPAEKDNISNFHLERVAQYLRNEPLREDLRVDTDEFNKFLQDNHDILEYLGDDDIFCVSSESSLVQVCLNFRQALYECIENFAISLGENINLENVINLSKPAVIEELNVNRISVCQWTSYDDDGCILLGSYVPRDQVQLCCFVKQSSQYQGKIIHFNDFKSYGKCDILSISHYNDRILTILLKQSNPSLGCILLQFDVTSLVNWFHVDNELPIEGQM
ncbi:DgyrCDS564 [Dimorphilus gyrociliatus]|uniref:Anaphase-promoting complex subunit 4 n=1 Tax=Dimorphilus gyrociliatus TaxID=2664684 RepID=A0A7I8V6J3_9ANNE|nr:DgyrCDS564 [Dimorphilus gyrociliatus]